MNENEVMPKQVWVNNKNGEFYEIICIATEATNSREGTSSVVYKKRKDFFVRDIAEFLEKFTQSDIEVSFYDGEKYLIPLDKKDAWENGINHMNNLGGEALDDYEYRFLEYWSKYGIYS
jgi:hypothetical protein